MMFLKNIFQKIQSYICNLLTFYYKKFSATTQHTQIKHIDETPLEVLFSQNGYKLSCAMKRPIAADGSPIPWYTYPAVEFFNQLNVQGLNIFEYSSGNSSLYWAQKGANVYSVEHSPEWFEEMSQKSSSLKALTLATDRASYASTIHNYAIDFDIIIIDGVWRTDCAREALTRCGSDTLVLLDNSDWYTDVAAILRKNSFFQIDWNGFGPINQYAWTTSLFLPFKSPLTDRLKMPTPIGGIQVGRNEELW